MAGEPTKPIRVGVFGPYGFGNMGDAALTDGTIAGLRRHIPNAEILGICQHPDNVTVRHGIQAHAIFRDYVRPAAAETQTRNSQVPPTGHKELASTPSLSKRVIRFVKSSKLLFAAAKNIQSLLALIVVVAQEVAFSFQVFRVVRQLDLMVMSGSGQLNEEWGGPWRYPFALFRWTLLARLTGCKVAFLSVGAGTVSTTMGVFFCASSLRLAHYKSVRDKQTLALVTGWNVREVLLIPDMAFGINFQIAPETDRDPSDIRIGINPIAYCDPRSWFQPDQERYKSYIKKIAEFCTHQLQRGYSIHFIPNELHMDNLVINDIIAQLAPDLRNSSRVVRPETRNYLDVFRNISRCDYLIASRFHGLLFSFMSKKPVITVAFHFKLSALASEMGQEDFCIDIANFQTEQMETLFETLVSRREQISQTIDMRASTYAEKVEDQYRKTALLVRN